jgi:GT2 family glycosyltransferase
VVANFNSRLPREVSLAQGAHMSFKKSALERIGGVDEKFDGNGYFWESDLSLRIVKAGYRILFEPRAELRHLMAPAGGCRVTDKSLHTYYFIKNGVRLCRRHSPWLARFVYLPRMIGYVVAKAVYNRDLAILRRGLLGVWDGVRL